MKKDFYRKVVNEIRAVGTYIANHAGDFICEHEHISEGSFDMRINVNPNVALPTVETSREIIVLPSER